MPDPQRVGAVLVVVGLLGLPVGAQTGGHSDPCDFSFLSCADGGNAFAHLRNASLHRLISPIASDWGNSQKRNLFGQPQGKKNSREQNGSGVAPPPVSPKAPQLPPAPTGGQPLPPFTLSVPTGTVEYEDSPTGRIGRVDGRVTFTMGDLRLEADHLIFNARTLHIEASGNVYLTRGDETLRGTSFVVESGEGTFTAANGAIASPPLFISGATVTRTPTEIRATDARIGLGEGGGGELGLRAREVRVVAGRDLFLQNATVSLFGVRLFTLRRVTLHLRQGEDGRTSPPERPVLPPVVFRSTRISGFVFGVGLPFTLTRGVEGRAEVDASTHQGLQSAFSLQHRLYGGDSPPTRRNTAARPGGIAPALASASPLRQMLTARPLPPPPDPVLDYDDILTFSSPLSNPTRAVTRSGDLRVNLALNREFGYRRQGALLLTRQPEVVATFRQPLSRPLPTGENETTKRALHGVRLYFTGETTTGLFDETQLIGGRTHVRGGRAGASVGLGTLPVLVGDRVLVQGESNGRLFVYQHGSSYRYFENTVSGSYVFARRTAVGASVIRRDAGGASPFLFDSIDTQNEGQIRGQVGLGREGRYTFAALGRYDLSQGRWFDYEYAFALRGTSIEPRLSYRRQNRQIGFTVAFPALSGL